MKTQRNAYYALFLCKIISVEKHYFCYKITNRMLQISHLENGVRAAQAVWATQAGKKLANEKIREWENEEVTFWNINFGKV